MSRYNYSKIRGDIRPVRDHILVINMEKGEKVTKGGIITLDDNGKNHGIRPRWAQVWRVGHEQTDIKAGQWVLVEHGRWTYGVEAEIPESADEVHYVQRVDVTGVLGVQDDCPF